ncbi:hypothetical protein D0865_00102 [Hortaea werneckii]|uniref:Thioesterase domain-containing protein n=1 Tax=Hortaea werneckii TaxID=91943 RepID=A0A3M7DFR1_HORWE|nr:hypothetical protein D0865_00102 [Hortaea werneckii]
MAPHGLRVGALVSRNTCRPGSSQLAQAPLTHRQRSTASHKSDQKAATASLSPRWLGEIKQRIGKCITFGLNPAQTARAGHILQEIARDWRELVAGSEGFLTTADRRGMHRQAVVWGEMDSMGHVNNVMYNRYAESGRIGWAQKLAMLDPANKKAWRELFAPTSAGLILRAITTEFKFPMKWPDNISVYHKLRAEPTAGTDSFILDVLIVSELHQRPAARCIEDIVVYDYTVGKKTALRPFMLDVFKDTWQLQEEAKRKNSARVYGLLDRVRQLEQESWDRKDAVEDMGAGKR